jgi:hypothetical protein
MTTIQFRLTRFIDTKDVLALGKFEVLPEIDKIQLVDPNKNETSNRFAFFCFFWNLLGSQAFGHASQVNIAELTQFRISTVFDFA